MLRRAIAGLASFVMLIGCASYGVYHGPEIVEPGSTEVGIGVMGIRSSEWVPEDPLLAPAEVSLIARHGLGRRVDVGGRLSLFPASLISDEPSVAGLYGDVRYQVVSEPVLLTGSLGASGLAADDEFVLGVYPALIAGSERFYGGIRGIARRVSSGDTATTEWALGIVSGAAFGEGWIIRPELNIYLADRLSTLLITPGVSVHRAVGR